MSFRLPSRRAVRSCWKSARYLTMSRGRAMIGRIDAFVGAHAYAGERLAPRPLSDGHRRSMSELGYGPDQGR